MRAREDSRSGECHETDLERQPLEHVRRRAGAQWVRTAMKLVNRRRIVQLLGASGAALATAPMLSQIAHADPSPPSCRGLCTRLTKNYGLKYPIVGAGMGF